MNLFSFLTRHRSAPQARERLQVLLSHERTLGGQSDLVAQLRSEILAVIAKHVQVDHDKVQVKMDGDSHVSVLEIEVEMPLDAVVKAA
jgi:cell division topological specificity factor